MQEKKNTKETHETILAIDPTVRGFGYVVFEGPLNPIDWGVASIRFCKNPRILNRIRKLIDFYQPSTILLEQPKNSLRCDRIKQLLRKVEVLARNNGVEVVMYSRLQVLEVFGQFGKTTKHEIATMIAESIFELAPRLPLKRKSYEPESEGYGVFDAAALMITHSYINS